jgi:hypothetical protein
MGHDLSDTPDHIIPDWFTREQWRELAPYVHDLISKQGGVLLISVEVALPKSYPFKYLSHNVSKNHDVKHD